MTVREQLAVMIISFLGETPRSPVKRICSIGTIPKTSLVVHIVIQGLSSPCFYLTGLDSLFSFLFPSLCHTSFEALFYTQCNSSWLLLTSRSSLSNRDKSIKHPSTTITKLYSNNTSWVARSRWVLESVLEVFILAWVMSSIAADQHNQSTAVLFLILQTLHHRPRCLLRFFFISPWGETGFQVTVSPESVALNSHNLFTWCPLIKFRND